MNIETFIRENERKDLLRFSTAGSIDDGKSTLIGRLLHDSKNVYEDTLLSVKNASKEKTSGEQIDFALLTDGLKAEREQSITIDVAYRYFSTPRRKFIIADTPGHEQYTRNMATGASTANLAIVLVDARNGILPQTKRHAFISSLLGVPHIVVAINKMDLLDYRQDVFDRIRGEFEQFASRMRVADLRFIPISALHGDNVVTRSANMPWYKGEALLEILENVYIGSDHNLVDFRFPVQHVIRPHQDFRGYAGRIASGTVRPGDEVLALPSMKPAIVTSIVTYDGTLEVAFPPQSVALTLDREIDVSRGEMLVHPHNVPRVDRRFEAMVVWLTERPLDSSVSYWIKHTTQSTRVRIDEVRYKVDVNTLSRAPAGPLALNEIGRLALTTSRPLFFDPYEKNRETGSFILIDPITNATAAAGMIIERESSEQLAARMTTGQAGSDLLRRRETQVSREERARHYRQNPCTVWLTGLAGSGKTEIAFALERRLFDLGAACVVLDGANIRLSLSRDLDFSTAGQTEHQRRVAETARLLNDAGLLVVCDLLSPLVAQRRQAAGIVGTDRFLEIYVRADAAWCEQHDTSGVYARARAGEVANLAGVNAAYEEPERPALTIDAREVSTAEAVDWIVALLRERGVLAPPAT